MPKFLASLSVTLILFQFTFAADPVPGNLANPGFENMPVKSVFFFTGNWRNGVQYYDYNPSDNRGLYTLHPSDARHLGWSENQSNRDFAVQTMIDAGVNVINMSYWGLPGTDNWAYWSPMQSSTASHDELFNAALGKEILIAPYLESFAQTDHYQGFSFADDFPGTLANPSPLLVSEIEDLVNRYLVTPDNAQWPSKWARVYDQDGQQRYLVSIIHVASNQESISDQEFAAGFDRVAAEVFESTGVHVGFALDILPPDSYAPGSFKATASSTGSYLAQQSSVCAIQCFLPEIWTGMSNENSLITWKRNYLLSWKNTGIPLIHDLTPGYDAHIVFPSSPVYGNTQSWRDLQTLAINDLGSKSLTFNAWNGYTEGMAGVPTVQYGDASYLWICTHFGGNCSNSIERMNGILPPENIEVLPNPVLDQVLVRLKVQDEHFISYKIVNSNGIIMKAGKINPYNGPDTSFNIPMDDLLPGMYFLVAKTNRSTYEEKVLKLNKNVGSF
jgi:hypothetical protein